MSTEKYVFLLERTLSRAKLGRSAILKAERDFHEALFKLSAHFPPAMFDDLEKHWLALSDFPCVLRSVLDALDEGNDLINLIHNIRIMEAVKALPPESEGEG